MSMLTSHVASHRSSRYRAAYMRTRAPGIARIFLTRSHTSSRQTNIRTVMSGSANIATTPAADMDQSPGAGPSRLTAAEKWVKPDGPPVGSQFGARLLTEEDDVWGHNAWDHVEPTEDFYIQAAEITDRHRANPVAVEQRDAYNAQPASYWNAFYKKNKDAFFKDRGWLRLEFPELIACSEAEAGPKVVLEVGCGAGNTVFPLLMRNENPDLTIHATDYSMQAVNVVKSNAMYPKAEHGKGTMNAAVWDISAKGPDGGASLPEGVAPGSVDVITVIFVLSALHPKEWQQAMLNLYTALKPGGMLLLRDYGLHDLAQLRITKDRLLDPEVPNLYIRGDGTRVYFFDREELRRLVEGGEDDAKRFEVFMIGEDRRLLVNRKEKKKMYRIWMQLKARKLAP